MSELTDEERWMRTTDSNKRWKARQDTIPDTYSRYSARYYTDHREATLEKGKETYRRRGYYFLAETTTIMVMRDL